MPPAARSPEVPLVAVVIPARTTQDRVGRGQQPAAPFGPAELVGALGTRLATGADDVQRSRRSLGGRSVGAWRSRRFAKAPYAEAFCALARRRVGDATNGFGIFRAGLRSDPASDLGQVWLNAYELEPHLHDEALRRHRGVEVPVTVCFHPGPRASVTRAIADWCRLQRPIVLLATGMRR